MVRIRDTVPSPRGSTTWVPTLRMPKGDYCVTLHRTDWDALEERVRGWLAITAKTNGLAEGRLDSNSVTFQIATGIRG